jgi:Arc/MetJ-type ribon-helix-helix transcriptional regulator
LPHTLLQLDEIRPTPTGDAGLAAWGAHRFRWENRLGCLAPEHLICVEDRREPTSDVRYALRRTRKRSAAIGARLRRLRSNADSIDALLAQIGAVEPCSWKGEQGIGVFSHDNADAIIEALRALAFEDRVRVAPPEHEGRCVSYRLGLLKQGRLHDYNLAFLPNYAHLGSGPPVAG